METVNNNLERWYLLPQYEKDSYYSTHASDARLESLRVHGRCSAYQYRLAKFFLTWCAERFEGPAGSIQDAYYAKMGRQALDRRIARARALWLEYKARQPWQAEMF